MIAQNKRLFGILAGIAILLLVPFIAMQFSRDVRWSPYDFIIAGILLLGTGLSIELVLRKVKTRERRIALCVTILALLFLVWVELAVGLFGTPIAGS
jgi:uncharacterized membrane protein YoaT (DUF817 family)